MPENLRQKSVAPEPGQIKTWRAPLREGGQDVIWIRVPVSSTGIDRDGDNFSEAGLESMARQYNEKHPPVFPNHGLGPHGYPEYRFEDGIGVWTAGEVEGETLFATAALDPEEWGHGSLIERRLMQGFPVRFSVGFIPLTCSDTSTGRQFDDVDLLETSVVGIPSNPAAVAELRAVVKSMLNAAGIEVPEEKTMTDKELKEKKESDEDEQDEEKSEEEEDDEEENSVTVLDEAAIRQIVADEIGKAVAPVMERLKAIATKSPVLEKKRLSPRAIVVAKETSPEKEPVTTGGLKFVP